MKLGVTTWTFETLSLQASLAVCKDLGFDTVDIAAFHKRGNNGMDPFEVGRNPEKSAEKLLKELEPWGVAIGDFFPQFGSNLFEHSLNDPNLEVREENRELIKGFIKFCQLTNIPGISLCPGMDHYGIDFKTNLDTSVEEFKRIVDSADGSGVAIRIEPHMQAITDTPEKTFYLLDKVPGTKVTLDYGHFLLQYVPMEQTNELLPYTDHVHVRQAKFGKLQTRTAEGTIDYADVVNRLKKLNYEGVFSIEYVNADWFDLNQVDCIVETALTKQQMENILQNL